VVERAAGDQEVLPVTAVERAGAGAGDKDVAPTYPAVERIPAGADQQIIHTLRSRRAAAAEHRGDAADQAADARGEAGLQIDQNTRAVGRIVQRRATVPGDVATQRGAVGEHKRIAAGAGRQVGDLTKENAAPVSVAAERAGVAADEHKDVSR